LDYISVADVIDVIGPGSHGVRGEISKISAITPFKVIQGQRLRYQSKARVRLTMCYNTNLCPILHRFPDMAYYWSNSLSRQGVPRFNALVRGLTSTFRIAKCCHEKLETLFSHVVQSISRYRKSFSRDEPEYLFQSHSLPIPMVNSHSHSQSQI